MIPTISELLQPLDERERLNVDRAAARLFSNDDFQLASKQMSQVLQDDIREFLKSQPSYRC